MSSSNRAISRLPLHIFTDLVNREDFRMTAEELREAISLKLARVKNQKGPSSSGAINDAVHGISTVGELFRMTIPALLKALDPLLTHVEIQELLYRIYKLCSPRHETAKAMLEASQSSSTPQFISSHVTSLDRALRGGFRVGTVTEIVGKAGVGKTQLSMQLCVIAAMQGFGTIYVDTEKKLSVERLLEIGRERSTSLMHDISITEASRFSSQEMLDNIMIHKPNDTHELKTLVDKLDEEILMRISPSTLPVKLIVLDSIAAPTRRDFGGGSAPQRVLTILQIAQTLKRIADQLKVAIVVINQVDKVISHSGDLNQNDYGSVTAALGPSWHHCVSTRIALEHQHDPHGDDSMAVYSDQGRKRIASIVKSNIVQRSSIAYEINHRGICDFG